MSHWIAIFIALLFLTLKNAVGAEVQQDRDLRFAGWDCQSSIDDYNSALDEISNRIKKYVNCLNSSNGWDDCSHEFRRLKSAQSDFESAVSDYQTNCE
jgi:type II secretory pathway pseudopilin PulG